MPKWKIVCANRDSGDDAVLVLESSDKESALLQACNLGYVVSECYEVAPIPAAATAVPPRYRRQWKMASALLAAIILLVAAGTYWLNRDVILDGTVFVTLQSGRGDACSGETILILPKMIPKNKAPLDIERLLEALQKVRTLVNEGEYRHGTFMFESLDSVIDTLTGQVLLDDDAMIELSPCIVACLMVQDNLGILASSKSDLRGVFSLNLLSAGLQENRLRAVAISEVVTNLGGQFNVRAPRSALLYCRHRRMQSEIVWLLPLDQVANRRNADLSNSNALGILSPR